MNYSDAIRTELNYSGVKDFDFLHGSWCVTHRTLKDRLMGATEWEQAEATDFVRPAFQGLGNVGCFVRTVNGVRFEGMPIRLYDPRSAYWRIYWLDTINQVMDPPVIGRFQHGTGLFLGDDYLKGEAIKVRFSWSRITSESARWEQAFSADGGDTWELNSIMDFQRNNNASNNIRSTSIEGSKYENPIY